ncbi:hypothetical protein [Mycolicibacterium agri]|jgi:hypothetical protein|uniref:Uncharacterized protein n=1 Tax=Mycolicibacterium agri TaxID=36811 RepID=A0A7I9VWF1_MYCAG|nr:hypothetical protein [Mycolicibacterium agri]GFG49438.1 hypothetical protein MAGR_08790 [Mycolicibacterium agri]
MGTDFDGKKILVVGGMERQATLGVTDRGGNAVIIGRPIDEILDIGEDERCCDSKTVDNRVRPFRVISACSKPAEWIYVMKCCGGHALACDPCHEHHLQPAVNRRYCTHCWHPFSSLADGARAVYRV